MSDRDVERVRQAFGAPFEIGGEAQLSSLFTDPAFEERLATLITPETPIEFATPDGGFVGDMAGPFFGVEGFRAGWAEWLEPWDSFVFAPSEWIDAGDGRVLLLGDRHGRLAGSGVELDTAAAALYELRDGRIVRIRHFLDQTQARRAAGLET